MGSGQSGEEARESVVMCPLDEVLLLRLLAVLGQVTVADGCPFKTDILAIVNPSFIKFYRPRIA